MKKNLIGNYLPHACGTNTSGLARYLLNKYSTSYADDKQSRQKKEFQFQFLLFSCSELPPRIKKAQPNLKKKKLNKQKPVKTQKVETGEKTKDLLTIAICSAARQLRVVSVALD